MKNKLFFLAYTLISRKWYVPHASIRMNVWSEDGDPVESVCIAHNTEF